MSFDLAAIRACFPALRAGGHPLDNAATAQVPDVVLDAVRAHDARLRANVRRGIHPAAEHADAAFAAARATIGRFLAAPADEVVFTAGCTAALNLAARALATRLGPGDSVVVSGLEHHANLLPWRAVAAERGAVLHTIPVGEDGGLDLAALPALLDRRTRVVAVTLASNVTGTVTDLAALAAMAHEVGAVVVADAAQAAPHGPLDARALGADLLAFAGHKAFGPTGIGVLWGRAELLAELPPVALGGGMVAGIDESGGFTPLPPPARFEAGTPPITQAIGLAAALDWQMGLDRPALATHERGLTARLLAGLAAMDEVRIVGPSDPARRIPLVAFTLAGCHPHDVAQVLAGRGVAVRAGHHCAVPLHAALGLEQGTVRASLAVYNGDDDVDALLAGLAAALGVLR
jgi:cysteine desulfurase/selenocysteine lyase